MTIKLAPSRLSAAATVLLLGTPSVTAQGSFVCGSVQVGLCLRSSSASLLRRFPHPAPEAASAATCCAACAAALPNCTSWQLSRSASASSASPDCDLLRDAIVASSTSRVCNSSVMVPTERVGRATLSGVWMQHGDLRTLIARGFLIGADLVIKWSTIEPADGVFDWSSVTTELAEADGAEFFMQAALQTGNVAPTWMYNRVPPAASVPMVNITPDPGHEDDQPPFFPYYLDSTYQSLFLRVQRAFRDYLARLPARLRRRIVSGQAMYGTTGDDTPWHGSPLNASFAISKAQWDNFTHSLSPAVCATFAGNATVERLPVLWNGDEADLDFYMAMCPGSLIKTGSASHGYQINFELEDYATKGAFCHTEGINCRGEEWPFSDTEGYLEAPVWGEYWHLLALLWFGTDRPGLSQPALDDPANLHAYTIFNRYAGSIRPPAAAWAGAIIALRDGLDAADTVRFPEAVFGGALRSNTTRNAAIVAAFAARGAAQGDPEAATRAPLGSRSPTSLNDIGWRVSAGNWGNGLAVQLAPNETSIGWWRVGPRSSPYGRFARGFHAASGRTAMSFVLDERLWGGLPLPASRGVSLRLRLVYFDAGGGVLTLAYDAAGGCTAVVSAPVATAAVVLLTPWAKVPAASESAPVAPGTWAEVSINITDGYFGRRCGPRGADIVLSSTSDTIVHGFEVYRIDNGSGVLASSTAAPTRLASASSTAMVTPTQSHLGGLSVRGSPPASFTTAPAPALSGGGTLTMPATAAPSPSLGIGDPMASATASTTAALAPALDVALLAGGAGGAVLLAAACLAAVYVCKRNKRKHQRVVASSVHKRRAVVETANPAACWRRVVDASDGAVFFEHVLTGKTVRALPTGAVVAADEELVVDAPRAFRRVVDPGNGAVFFQDVANGAVVWTLPAGARCV